MEKVQRNKRNDVFRDITAHWKVWGRNGELRLYQCRQDHIRKCLVVRSLPFLLSENPTFQTRARDFWVCYGNQNQRENLTYISGHKVWMKIWERKAFWDIKTNPDINGKKKSLWPKKKKIHSKNFTISWISHCVMKFPFQGLCCFSPTRTLLCPVMLLYCHIYWENHQCICGLGVVTSLWARADWLREPQWRILLLETLKSMVCISLMFSYFLWALWPCTIDILCHIISINGTTDIFLLQLEINFKSRNPHGQPSVTGSLGMRVSGGRCINTQQINNNGE